MPADIATLLAEAPWLERLARSLTGDAVEADDLVQDTYAAALCSPPETDRPIRPWLRRVAINLVRMRHRVRVRRAATESVVETQAEPVRDAGQLLDRARLERRLAELVLELDEPFRTTVLLRYREGLGAEQIATQQALNGFSKPTRDLVSGATTPTAALGSRRSGSIRRAELAEPVRSMDPAAA